MTEPVILVFFGITGDLSQRKLLPALYHLMKDGLLHEDSVILGITRRDVTAADLLSTVELCVNEVDKVCDPVGLRKVQAALRMHTMDLDDGEAYDKLLTMLSDIETEKAVCMDRLYYLSVPPGSVGSIVEQLGQHGHNQSCQHGNAASRLLVEKPFGRDLASAEKLIVDTNKWFDEQHIFRIDHYVAKEAVENVLRLRQSSPVVTDVWNNQQIASIEVTANEQLTIEGRAVFYEGVGALRDFLQSHSLQMLTIATMELPARQDSDAVHAAKLALLESVTPIGVEEVAGRTVRGQYEGYREEVGNPDSITETYASLTLSIDNPRWQGVPMTIRTGKAMARQQTEIKLVFKSDAQTSPELIFMIQPDQGIRAVWGSAKPAFGDELQAAINDFKPAETTHPDGYERVLVDAARGDHTVFTTAEEVLASWRIVENVLKTWGASGDSLTIYPKASQTVLN